MWFWYVASTAGRNAALTSARPLRIHAPCRRSPGFRDGVDFSPEWSEAQSGILATFATSFPDYASAHPLRKCACALPQRRGQLGRIVLQHFTSSLACGGSSATPPWRGITCMCRWNTTCLPAGSLNCCTVMPSALKASWRRRRSWAARHGQSSGVISRMLRVGASITQRMARRTRYDDVEERQHVASP